MDGGSGADIARWCGVLAAVVLAEAGVVRHRSTVLLYIRTHQWAPRGGTSPASSACGR